LAEETHCLSLIGLGESLQIELEINDAYVPLRTVVARSLTGQRHGLFSEERLAEAGPVEVNVPLAEMFTIAHDYAKRGIILLGEPGAGKTTGARQLCWLLASGAQRPADLGLPPGVVPVLLRFRNLPNDHAAKGFQQFVLSETRGPDATAAAAHPGPELWHGEPRLWVFDGLDEVVSEAVRIQVCQRLQAFLRQRPQDYVLVTSRYQGYGQKVDLGPGFIQFHVQPLKPDQVEAFVDKWFTAAYQQLYRDKPKAQQEATADAGNLKRILNQPEYTIGGLRELRTNPLLLTVVCLVYHQEHSLPRGRAALYEKCVTVLLESWRKGLYDQQRSKTYDPRAAQRVLAQLAWWMHCQSEGEAAGKKAGEEDRRGSPSAKLKEMAAAVAPSLAETAAGAGLGRDGQRFIERMRDESGILVTAQPECCSFLHLTFQEYLAATHAVEEGLARELVTRAGQSWWREPILLALARASGPFAKQFFAAFLDSPAWEADLAFTARCLEETAVTDFAPFLKKLKHPQVPNAQKVCLLQLLRQKDDPALLKLCGPLAGNADAELVAAAREILARAKGPETIAAVAQRPAELATAAQPGQVQVDPRTGIAFIHIPAGEFDMGSETGDSGEKPVHRVRISKPFLLGKYQVTNQEYQRFLEANPKVQPPGYWSSSQFNDPQQPVVGVSWEDAQVFCQWAGGRRPTEGEWEYACRAGSKGRYCFGDDEAKLGDYAWYGPNSGSKTHPVGQKKPNAWGLYDVHGNVWEWCQDWFGNYPKGPVIDPTGPEKGDWRVLRGGSWNVDLPAYLSSSYRDFFPPGSRDDYYGFRCVVGVVGSAPR
jgi:formylglycine-generating enzyme required for sulfatase activity